jgi:hypothetical protein
VLSGTGSELRRSESALERTYLGIGTG